MSPRSDQADIERQVRRINESFDAIIPESGPTQAQRRRRRFALVESVVRPIIKHMAGYVMKTGVSYEELSQQAGGLESLRMEGRSVIDRSVTSHTFADLMKTESIQSLVKHHFSVQRSRRSSDPWGRCADLTGAN
jgi:hypothetical protein